MHGVFGNGDGLFVMLPDADTDNTNVHVCRALYTDSGHYLLPTDDPRGQIEEESFLAEICLDQFEQIALTADHVDTQGEVVPLQTANAHRYKFKEGEITEQRKG